MKSRSRSKRPFSRIQRRASENRSERLMGGLTRPGATHNASRPCGLRSGGAHSWFRQPATSAWDHSQWRLKILCMLLGSGVQVVRRKRRTYYLLIGECYVHGLWKDESK